MDARSRAYYQGMADCANALALATSGYSLDLLAYYQWVADWHAVLNGAATTTVKINLGCGDVPLAGFVNVDIVPAPGIEVADLTKSWPWPDSSVDYVRASHIVEHLPDKIFTMNELWRVLKSNAKAHIELPTTDGPGAWQDPTHVSFWNRRSFLYYEAGSLYREAYAHSYGIRAKFRTIWERTDQTPDGPILTIVLRAVKQ